MPVEFLTDCLFLGKEVEGEYAGRITLFVGSLDIPYSLIKKALKKHPEVEAVYFGAGGKYGISKECAERVWQLFEKVHIVIEINDLDQLKELGQEVLELCYIVYTIPISYDRLNLAHAVSCLKFETENVVLCCSNFELLDSFINRKDDPGYNEDKPISDRNHKLL